MIAGIKTALAEAGFAETEAHALSLLLAEIKARGRRVKRVAIRDPWVDVAADEATRAVYEVRVECESP